MPWRTGIGLIRPVVCGLRGWPSGVGAMWWVLTAAPPLGWIGSVKMLSPEHRSYVARHIGEPEAQSVAPGTTTTLSLASYYRRAGFTVLAPGEGIAVADPLGLILHRPADPHVVQMWKPLHREVAVVDSRLSDGTPFRLLTGVLVPPADASRVVRHDDGSLTIGDGGVGRTVDTRTAGMLERMYRTPVTEEQVRAGMAEALRYGMEPRSWRPGSARRRGTPCLTSWAVRAATGLR